MAGLDTDHRYVSHMAIPRLHAERQDQSQHKLPKMFCYNK